MANIYEVAELAGVSLATVSRVINPGAKVSEKTRQKVLAAMEQLGYKPNSIAQSLATRSSNAVGVLVSPLFGDSVVKFRPAGVSLVSLHGKPAPRAALVANNTFLTALGRPNRETVSTGRESQANLLQALELTNGKKFNQALLSGAEVWKEKYPDTRNLVTAIYRNALLRAPRETELKAAMAALGDTPDAERVADMLWAILLLPEFQLIY